MNTEQLRQKTAAAVRRQCGERGYAAPVDVLMEIGVLTKQKYEDWRFGRIPFLEAACTANLHELSEVMHTIRSIAVKDGLKKSVSAYKKWGKGKKTDLRFSKSRNPNIERGYATHYVDTARVAELKAQKAKEKAETAAQNAHEDGDEDSGPF